MKMSERSESKRLGAKQHKNSGRNTHKGDATWKNFTVDFKEVGKSFTLNQKVWAKATTDAINCGGLAGTGLATFAAAAFIAANVAVCGGVNPTGAAIPFINAATKFGKPLFRTRPLLYDVLVFINSINS